MTRCLNASFSASHMWRKARKLAQENSFYLNKETRMGVNPDLTKDELAIYANRERTPIVHEGETVAFQWRMVYRIYRGY